MNKSESIAALSKAFAKAQPAIEGAVKDKTNPHFRSKYADLGAVTDAIKPALQGTGLSFVQVCHDAQDAAKVETIILHESGEWLSCGAVSVPVSKSDAQGYGSALTYARRYSLSAAFGVAPEDDDGNAAAAAKPIVTPGSVAPRAGIKHAMDKEQRQKVDALLSKVLDWFSAGSAEDAFAEIDNAALGNEEKTYLWDLLDSKQRSTLTKIGETRRANALNA
jgi:hypothetical protein